MFSFYKSHKNSLYIKLVELSRNFFFYKKVLLKDDFETRINLVFIHFCLLLIAFKKKKKIFPQENFDNIFLNIEYHIRELGYGDVTVNKKMKTLTRIFYDILIKLDKSKNDNFEINNDILKTYFCRTKTNISQLTDNLTNYFNDFYSFCFELNVNSVLKGQINFKYRDKNGSS